MQIQLTKIQQKASVTVYILHIIKLPWHSAYCTKWFWKRH